MSARVQPPSLAERLRRILAGGCAALVLTLSIFASSPVAHEFLHAGEADHPENEDACAVVMFAGGVPLAVGGLALNVPTSVGRTTSPTKVSDVFLMSPRYLRQPERGPPVGLAA